MREWLHIPLTELMEPKPGPHTIYVDYWWTVDPEQGALILKRDKRDVGMPQCNSNRLIVERMLRDRPHDRYVAMQLHLAFMRHECPPEYPCQADCCNIPRGW
jgi:hypothetical protein